MVYGNWLILGDGGFVVVLGCGCKVVGFQSIGWWWGSDLVGGLWVVVVVVVLAVGFEFIYFICMSF